MPWKKGAGFGGGVRVLWEGGPSWKGLVESMSRSQQSWVTLPGGWQSRAAVPFGLMELKQLPEPQGKFLTTVGPKSIAWDF